MQNRGQSPKKKRDFSLFVQSGLKGRSRVFPKSRTPNSRGPRHLVRPFSFVAATRVMGSWSSLVAYHLARIALHAEDAQTRLSPLAQRGIDAAPLRPPEPAKVEPGR